MRSINDVSEEEKEEITNFFDFYSESYIELLSDIRKDSKEDIVNKDVYKFYFNIIKSCGKLIKEVGFNDPISISVLFQYLLWNGYLSKDNNLVYSISNRKNMLGLPGADIMLGKSVCLNNSSMLTDVLKESGFEAYTLGCLIPSTSDKVDFEYRPDIIRNIIDTKLNDKVINFILGALGFDHLGNHAVTCFKYNEMYSISDPTTLAFCNFTDLKKFRYVGSDFEGKLKAWLMVICNDISYNDFKDMLMKIFVMSDLVPFDVEIVKKFSETTLDYCKSNVNLLNDFHGEINNDIDGVCKILKK